MITRRNMLAASAAMVGSAALLSRPANLLAAAVPAPLPADAPTDITPVVIPNGTKLLSKVVAGVKVFHLIAEEVLHEFAPGLVARCWGYNGSVHGPLIEAVDGDTLRIYVTNRLPAATTVHWHGILLPNGMDGVSGLSQNPIPPGQTFKYEFTLHQSGTYMYHSHHDEMTQMGLGMTGMFIIHPRNDQPAAEPRPKVDRDFALLLHEWRIDPGTDRPNPAEMTEFNILTMNAKVFPATAPLVVKTGDRVRIRLGNLGAMEHHPIHLHGAHFVVTDIDGGQVPRASQIPQTTVLVPVGSTRTIEFIAAAPGDWPFHCHMSHHVMNQMGHRAPNMIGVKTGSLGATIQPLLPMYMPMGQNGMADMGDMGMPVPPNSIPMLGGKGRYGDITMGGMFTLVKVRDTFAGEADPGWYESPPGTLAQAALSDDLARDGIDPSQQ